MNSLVIKRNNITSFIFILQVIALLIYLFANILNIGESGTALPILILYILLSCLILLVLFLGQRMMIKFHFLFFLIYLFWISLKVIIDLGDISYLKEIVFGTTGGILFFYMVGAMLGLSFFSIIEGRKKIFIPQVILLFFLLFVGFLFNDYSQRLSETLVFLISDIEDDYQRPGNFMSISFIIISYLFFYYSLSYYENIISYKGFCFWIIVYSASASLLLITTQMIGSNSATAVVLGIFIITLVMSLVSVNNDFIKAYKVKSINLSNSKILFKKIIFFGLSGAFFVFMIFSVILIKTDFDIKSLRLFGFGQGETSLSSRNNILLNTGLDQLSYAPIFGDMNVAYQTTGVAGRTLHSFLPYIMSHLGLIGLTIVCMIFYMIFKQLLSDTKSKESSYKIAMTSLFSFFILLFIFLFANLSSGMTWAVLNFSIGFLSKPIFFKNSKYSQS